jgi:cell division protein FtsL
MTQEKLRRVVTAAVVAGTTLFVILLSVLIYQWITIAVYDKRIEEINEEIAALEQDIAEDERNLDYYSSDLGKFWLAIEKGFVEGNK